MNDNVFVKRRSDIAEMADIENALALSSNLRAMLDYVAMMADIELPEEDENVTEI